MASETTLVETPIEVESCAGERAKKQIGLFVLRGMSHRSLRGDRCGLVHSQHFIRDEIENN